METEEIKNIKEQPSSTEQVESNNSYTVSFKDAHVSREYLLVSSTNSLGTYGPRYYTYDYQKASGLKVHIIGEVVNVNSEDKTPFKKGDIVLLYTQPIYANAEGNLYYYLVPVKDVIMWWKNSKKE